METIQQEREIAMSGTALAFDLWLKHGLKKMYAKVLEEPVPDELEALILR